ncbi:unnamed protein product [Prunus armeniaca]
MNDMSSHEGISPTSLAYILSSIINPEVLSSPSILGKCEALEQKFGRFKVLGIAVDLLQNKKDASGLYGKSFPHYYTLGEIFGKDHAIGTNAGNADDDEEDVRRDDASVHQNRSVGDDFIKEMFSHLDGGSQYGGSEYEGSQFDDVEDLEDDETTFTQPNPQPSSAQQKRPAQDVASGPSNPRRKVNALNEMSNKFGLMAEAVAGMAPQLAGLVNVLST